jgi:transposase
MKRRKQTCPSCKKLEEDIILLKDMVAKLIDKNQALEKELQKLKEQVNQDSSNSSLPPSSDPPGKKPKRTKPKSRRKRGAQPGHEDQQRQLYSLDQVDEIVPCIPDHCEHCDNDLKGQDPKPRREQKVEVEIKQRITEYQIHTLPCECCGHETTGKLPQGVRESAFGAHIQAIVSLLSGAYRLSKREIKRIMNDVFNVDMSLGSVCNLENATSKALEAPVEEAKEYVKNQPVVHLDETGWREAKKKAWLWTAVTAAVVVFVIRLSRGSKVAKELIGEGFKGIVNSDRWSAYSWIDSELRQLCWAHLQRDFQKLVDRGGISAKIGKTLLDWSDKMFEYWQRVRDGTLKRSSFYTYLSEIRQHTIATLEAGAVCRNSKTARFCKNILKLQSALWTFARIEGVEPTNNAAERAVRKPVLWRKGSFGTDSPKGSRFVERILTTVATLRAQNRNVLDYLVEACSAAERSRNVPSLLPDVAPTP